jgi:hypothetical protein
MTELTENKRFKKVIDNVLKAVEGGSSLTDALAKHPKQFPRLYTNMVRAGETGGVLELFADCRRRCNREPGIMLLPLQLDNSAWAEQRGGIMQRQSQSLKLCFKTGAVLPPPKNLGCFLFIVAEGFYYRAWWLKRVFQYRRRQS